VRNGWLADTPALTLGALAGQENDLSQWHRNEPRSAPCSSFFSVALFTVFSDSRMRTAISAGVKSEPSDGRIGHQFYNLYL